MGFAKKVVRFPGTEDRLKTVLVTALFVAGWLFLWISPWQAWLGSHYWLRLGLALGIFIVPGAGLFALLDRDRPSGLKIIGFGFVLSHLVLALLGTAGRLLHFSFGTVKIITVALGVVLIIATLANRKFSMGSLRGKLIPLIRTFLAYLPLILVLTLALLMTIQRVITDDDLAYLAHLHNWQNSPGLSFEDVYFGTGSLDTVRLWIVSAPFSQALLADLSGLPGILVLGGYYEPFLAVIALLCLYDLARTLGLSRRLAVTATLAQVLLLALLSDYLHPGAPFFLQLSTDKASAAFIFVPVFIQSVVRFLREPRTDTLIVCFLTGMSLSLMHPVILAFAVLIVGAMAVFGLRRENLGRRIGLLGVILLLVMPHVFIRYVDSAAQADIPFGIEEILRTKGIENVITVWKDTPFYGFNPAILGMNLPYAERIPLPLPVLQFGWLVIPALAAILAVKRLRDSELAQYSLAGFLLSASAGIPLTGWVLGYFLSAWMLERANWLYPFGLSFAWVLHSAGNYRFSGRRLKDITVWSAKGGFRVDLAHVGLMAVWAGSLVVILSLMRTNGLPNLTRLERTTQRYRELAQVGEYLDAHLEQPGIAVGSDELNDFIPAVSWKAKVISYRPGDTSYPYFFTPDERTERLRDRRSIVSRQFPAEERLALIEKYGVDFILVEAAEYDQVKRLPETFPASFEVHEIGRFILLEVR